MNASQSTGIVTSLFMTRRIIHYSGFAILTITTITIVNLLLLHFTNTRFLFVDSLEQLSSSVSLFLLGSAMLLTHKNQARPALCLTGIVTLMCIITLSSYLIGYGTWMDRLFSLSHNSYSIDNPGRIPPNLLTGLLLGVVVTTVCSGASSRLLMTPALSMLGVLVIGISGAALLGYGFEIEVGHTWGENNPLPIPSAVALLALGVGLIALVWSKFSARTLKARELWRAVTIYAMSALFTFGMLTAFYAALPFYDWIQKDTLEDLARLAENHASTAQQAFDAVRATAAAIQQVVEQETEQIASRPNDFTALNEIVELRDAIEGYTRSEDGRIVLQTGIKLKAPLNHKAHESLGIFSFSGPIFHRNAWYFIGVAQSTDLHGKSIRDTIIVNSTILSGGIFESLKSMRGVNSYFVNHQSEVVLKFDRATGVLHKVDEQFARYLKKIHEWSPAIESDGVRANRRKGKLSYGVFETFNDGQFSIVEMIEARDLFRQINQDLIEFLVIAFLFISSGSFGVFFLVRELVLYVERLQRDIATVSAQATALFQNSSDAILTFRKDGTISSANNQALKMFGRKLVDSPDHINALLEDHQDGMQPTQLLENPKQDGTHLLAFQRISEEGHTKQYLEGLFAALEMEGERLGALFLRDVTERRTSEQLIADSLAEKEVLLKEIHHRVKNNLQVISSLLRLQARKTDNQSVIDVLKESQNRIGSIAILHELLYQSNLLATIDFKGYVERLCHSISSSYAIGDEIAFEMKVAPFPLPLEKAMPCGLLITEIVTNILKHAFPKKWPDKRIMLTVVEETQGLVQLTIADNGKGIESQSVSIIDGKITFDRAYASLGLQLINNLIMQLDGDYQIESGPERGTKYRIVFALEQLERTNDSEESTSS